MITLEPGLHDRIPEDVYHRDPAAKPSLSASIAKLLVGRSPLHAYFAHPRLNPTWQPDSASGRQDIGTAAHALLLGVGKGMKVVDAENWRTKAARAARDRARADSQVPVLVDDAAAVRAMTSAIREQLRAHEVGDVTEGCRPEVTMVWRTGPIWCRARIDALPGDFTGKGRVRVIDLKTTSGSAEPDAATSRLYDQDADVQAVFYEDGLRTLHPEITEVEFLFLMVEQDPPHALSVLSLSNTALEQAREKVDEAKKVWRTCMEANRWPGYPPRVCHIDPPGWVAHRHEERKQLGTTPSALLKIAMEWQAPHGRAA